MSVGVQLSLPMGGAVSRDWTMVSREHRLLMAGAIERDQAERVAGVYQFRALIHEMWGAVEGSSTGPPEVIQPPRGTWVCLRDMTPEQLPTRSSDGPQRVWWLGSLEEGVFRPRVAVFFAREHGGRRILPHFGVRIDAAGQVDYLADGTMPGRDLVIFERGACGVFAVAGCRLVQVTDRSIVGGYSPSYTDARRAQAILDARVAQLRSCGLDARAAALCFSRPVDVIEVLRRPPMLVGVDLAAPAQARVSAPASHPLLPDARGRALAARAAGDD